MFTENKKMCIRDRSNTIRHRKILFETYGHVTLKLRSIEDFINGQLHVKKGTENSSEKID